jgi:hypothetical protein
MVSIKRISYAYNSLLEGQKPYLLDCYVSEDGRTVLDVHEQLATKAEFDQRIEGIVPLLEERSGN